MSEPRFRRRVHTVVSITALVVLVGATCVAGTASAAVAATAPPAVSAPSPGTGFGGPGPEAAAPAAPLTFSGRTWRVKTSTRGVGPGPNVFSAANVSVDPVGRLHLAISRTTRGWSCAEVWLDQSLGYGTYEWQLASDVSALDASAVLGLFTWSDAPDYNHREIDFEASRWGVPNDPTNAQWVVQPFDAPGNLTRWTIGRTVPSVVRFTWSRSGITFEALAGGVVVSRRVSSGAANPLPGGEQAHMNLWLYQGHAPRNGQPLEVVVDRFTYRPLP
ncbi:MAG: hypothetical protein WCI50_03815 [Actinomycetes bacterium]